MAVIRNRLTAMSLRWLVVGLILLIVIPGLANARWQKACGHNSPVYAARQADVASVRTHQQLKVKLEKKATGG